MVDLSPIIFSIFNILLLVIPIMILSHVFRSHWFKGMTGEYTINLVANLFLDKKEYHLIKNVTLPTEDGSTQIDLIVVSTFGVFVIETKNMKGWIFGSPYQKTWTQKIFKHTNKFQNPLRQNYKHVKVLQSLLGLDDSQIHSVIVFIGDSCFKTDMPENVTYGSGYIKYIKSKKTPVLSGVQVVEIIRKIEDGRFARSFKTNRSHVRHVKDIKARQKDDHTGKEVESFLPHMRQAEGNITSLASRRRVCPQCGGTMVLREIKKGKNVGKKFFGCASFPKCRGVLSIKYDNLR